MTATTATAQHRGRTARRRDTLRREIIFALAVKAAVIYGLWYAFFSEPVDDSLTETQVGHAVFGSTRVGQEPSPQQTLTLTNPVSEEN